MVALDNTLEDTITGNASPEEALLAIRKALKDQNLAGNASDAMTGLCFKLLTSRIYGSEAKPWHDMFRQISAFADAKQLPNISIRANVFADLCLELIRTAPESEDEELKKLLSRQHVLSILIALKDGGETRRASIIQKTGLTQQNFSRILALLSTHGLVQRKSLGKEALLSITDLGRRSISDCSAIGNFEVTPPLTRVAVS